LSLPGCGPRNLDKAASKFGGPTFGLSAGVGAEALNALGEEDGAPNADVVEAAPNADVGCPNADAGWDGCPKTDCGCEGCPKTDV